MSIHSDKVFYDRFVPKLRQFEGGYVNHPSDRGGETNHGIKVGTARRYGYNGSMRDMPWTTALAIYKRRYWDEPGFWDVSHLSAEIAVELADTGVNMGQSWPALFLQKALNRFNRRQRDYKNIREDGDIGPATLKALEAYLGKRGRAGERVMLKSLNILQGARYFDITPEDDQNEDFMFGWIDNRV